MTEPSISGTAAIVGIGATEFSKNSGRSEMRLAVEAIKSALDDAGISPREVDGLCTLALDNNAEYEVFRNLGGEELKYWTRSYPGGGAACAPVQAAAMAVATGMADVVVCYRALNEYSQYRYSAGYGSPGWSVSTPSADAALKTLHTVHGLRTAAGMMAVLMRRYMHDYGATSDDFARVSVAARRHAATNPAALFYGRPITIADYHQSRMIADPFRLFDCCQESDGAVAIVVTSAARARELRQKPAIIAAAAQGASRGQIPMTNYYRPDISVFTESEIVAKALYRASGVTPQDIQTAIIYDHFGPAVLPQLEAYGFCARGEAKDFIRDGNIEIGGGLPLNTHGGNLAEAYVHGMNGIAEAVRQVRGTSVNQVSGVNHVLVTGGSGVTTSGLILRGN